MYIWIVLLREYTKVFTCSVSLGVCVVCGNLVNLLNLPTPQRSSSWAEACRRLPEVTSRFLHQNPAHTQIMLVNTLHIHTTPHIRMQLVPMHGRYKSPTLLYSKYSTLHFTCIFQIFLFASNSILTTDGEKSSPISLTTTTTWREWTKKYTWQKHTHHLI